MAPATSHIKVSSSEYVVPKKLFSSHISQLSKKSKLGNAQHTATTLNTNLLNDIHAKTLNTNNQYMAEFHHKKVVLFGSHNQTPPAQRYI